MKNPMAQDLLDQYRRSFKMLYEEMDRFNEQQWLIGLPMDPAKFQVPVKLAMHIVDCLDYYFSGKSGDQYHWGYRFGAGYWELPDDRLPGKADLLVYTREIETRVTAELSALSDADLAKPFTTDDSGSTFLGHYIYALRHTLHHHGELAALAVYHGLAGGSWE